MWITASSNARHRLQRVLQQGSSRPSLQQRRAYMDVHTRPSHSGMFRKDAVTGESSIQSSPAPEILLGMDPPDSDPEFYRMLIFRVLAACSTVYCLTEYCADITLTEGPSMHPTIRASGEIILVDKLVSGVQHGSLDAATRVFKGIERQAAYEKSAAAIENDAVDFWHEPVISVSDLERPSWRTWWSTYYRAPLGVGDTVVVQHPNRRGTVCKRILGLAGDQILLYRPGRFGGANSPQQVVTIPTGHIWIEGDNPNNSADSRTYGPVPASLVVGRVIARIWPLRGNAVFLRGGRPHQTGSGEPCTGSTMLPAGYQGQHIVKHVDQRRAKY